ncbi:MAG: YCF48-related protein [Caldimonas sp.]
MRRSDHARACPAGNQSGTITAIAVLLAACLASACGGGGGDAGDSATQAVVPTTVQTITGPDGATLRLPSTALPGPVTVRLAKDSMYAPALPGAFAAAGDTYAATPLGLSLRQTVTVRIPVAAGTPDDGSVVLAASNPDGTWTIRLDAKRDGAFLQIEASQLGHFTVVRFAPRGVSRALAKARPADVSPTQNTFFLTAPGFADDGTFVTNSTPYPSSTKVPFTVTPYVPDPINDYCPLAAGFQLWPKITNSDGTQAPWIVPKQVTSFPIQPGPWSFDLEVYRPIFTNGLPQMTTDVDIGCAADTPDYGTLISYYLRLPHSARYSVAVAGELVFLSRPVDTSVAIGAVATFDVRIVGGPPAPTYGDQYSVAWERSGDGGTTWLQILNEFETDVSEGSLNAGRLFVLTLANLAAADNGTLIRARACFNECATSEAARLQVGQVTLPPVIVQQPRSISTQIGETADFTVAVAPTPVGTIRWQVLTDSVSTWLDVGSPGATWPGATPNAVSLVTLPATPAQNGWLFRAVVSNAGGSVVSESVVWRVTAQIVAPSITTQPVATSVPLGATALLAAFAEGTAPLSYQWTRDGLPLAGGTGPVLSIANVQASAVGTYRLTVTGPGGRADSDAIALTALAVGPPATDWQVLPSGIGAYLYDIAMVGGDPNALVAVGFEDLVRSIDGGAHWTTIPTAATAGLGLQRVRFRDANVGIALGGGDILRTADGGVTWTVVWHYVTAEGLFVASPRSFDWIDADTLVAVTNGPVLRSTDAGLTWQIYGSATVPAGDVAFDGSLGIAAPDFGSVSSAFRTTDGGLTWSEVAPGFFVDPQLRVAHSSAGVWLIAGGAGIYASSDDGLTWSRTNYPSTFWLGLRAHGSQVVVCGDAGRVMRSADGGLTWATGPDVAFGQLWGVEFVPGGPTIAVGAGGLIVRRDGG